MDDKKLKPTKQQQAFIDALLNTTCHLALVARAGTGKTSTILMGVTALAKAFPGLEILVCAYNKAIADEVSARLIALGHTNWKKISASTIHSMGFGLLKWLFKPKVDDKKVKLLVESHNENIYHQYGAQIISLVKMAKQAGFGFFSDLAISDTAAWHALADHFDINGLDDTSEADAVVEAAQIIYRASLDQTAVIDFDDMILMPLIKNLRVKFTKDVIFLDEAQDLSRARQALARKFLARDGRLIIVGDDRQAIYGFSGADAAALDNLTKMMGATTIPLSVTWRCPKEVVKLAQTLVPDIEAAPSAAEGEVIKIATLPEDLNSTDAILCRNTAPLIALAYELIRDGKPCKVEGRSIGEGLKTLATRWKIKSIDMLLRRLSAYEERERQKALAKGNEAKAEQVEDVVNTLTEICKACTKADKHNITDVVDFIDDLFADGAKNVTILATYHRSKGREWPRVILLEHNQRCPSKAARQQWQITQEHNLAYVAFTRAQETLAFLN